ncbi:hypothetical protein I4U23_016642 [Adineta vaga]|nr:hypothetical protein I4U23_016642 [Adineta vaga]
MVTSQTTAKSGCPTWPELIAAKYQIREAEAADIKQVLSTLSINDQDNVLKVLDALWKKNWSKHCQQVRSQNAKLWLDMLGFFGTIRRLGNDLAQKVDSKREYQTSVLKTYAIHEDPHELTYLCLDAKNRGQKYSNDLTILSDKSVYGLYGIILASREKMRANLTNLSSDDAMRYCDYAVIASLPLQDKSPSQSDMFKTINGNSGPDSIFELNHIWWYYKCILIIFQTVLTLDCLTDSEKKVFDKDLETVQYYFDVCEAYFIYKLTYAYFEEGHEVNHDNKPIIEKYEQILINRDAYMTIQFLIALTALHFQRECQQPLLSWVITYYEQLVGKMSDTNVQDAIKILRAQPIKRRREREPSTLSTLQRLSEMLSYETENKRWYKPGQYLRISNISEVPFSVYIHASEILSLMKLISAQFARDFDGLYEEETTLGLPHQTMSSIVIYLRNSFIKKAIKDIKKVEKELGCGQQPITINPDDLYLHLQGSPDSYNDLKARIFNSRVLLGKPKEYARHFRTIINEGGSNMDDDVNRDFVLFTHAKVIAESARNVRTWLINLMCLDMIESEISLNSEEGNYRGTWSKGMHEMYSPWNLFFDYHPMNGGSFSSRQLIPCEGDPLEGEDQPIEKHRNEGEIENAEIYIAMNWLCASWLGTEAVATTDVIEDNLDIVERNELEDADRYGRHRIMNMLFYRMYLTCKWNIHCYDDVTFTRDASTSTSHARRILGKTLRDEDSLRIHVLSNSDQPRSNLAADRCRIAKMSYNRFKELIRTTENEGLKRFYQQKLDALRRN